MLGRVGNAGFLVGVVSVAAVCVAVSLTWGAGATRAAFPGGNGLIAYESNQSGSNQIWVMDPDGSHKRRLTSAGGEHPVWSPDGTRIAFDSGASGDGEIWVMDADGSNVSQLTHRPAATDIFPSWSPDGTKIAFASYGGDNYDIWVIGADGTGATDITNNPSEDILPVWSPDGSKIAFQTSRDGNREIYEMNPNGTATTNITMNAAEDENPDWSPDGTEIAFDSNRDGTSPDVFTMNADGTNVSRLTTGDGTGSYNDYPAWSPDGSRIAFTSFRDFNDEIYVMDADGSNANRLTNNAPPGNTDPVDWFADWGTYVPLPPDNDAFAQATSLNGAATPINAENVYASKEAGEPLHGSDVGGASVWYSWTPSFSGTGFVSTAGSDFDTLVGVYTGSAVSSLAQVASNDDAAAGSKTSRACFPVVSGTTYRIAIDGYAAAAGYERRRGNINSRGASRRKRPLPRAPSHNQRAMVAGSPLGASTGTWFGTTAGFDFQWFACDPTDPLSCFSIDGATSSLYDATHRSRRLYDLCSRHRTPPN